MRAIVYRPTPGTISDLRAGDGPSFVSVSVVDASAVDGAPPDGEVTFYVDTAGAADALAAHFADVAKLYRADAPAPADQADRASRGRLLVADWRGGTGAAPTMGAAENVPASDVAEIVRDLAAYVREAGGDWEALAAGRPGWAADAWFGWTLRELGR